MTGLFFLRHNNDIDHVVPVIHQWSQAGHASDVVLMGDASLLDDFRIRFLAGLDRVRVAAIGDVLPATQFLRLRGEIALLGRTFRRYAPKRAAQALSSDERRNRFWQQLSEQLLDRSFAGERSGVVAFDWITDNSVLPVEWVRCVVAAAQARGLGTVSLPHGDSPHWNKLIRRSELSIEPDQKFAAAKMFDRLVVPNELCAQRFRPFLDPNAIAVLGSPRYCDEWLARLTELLPASPLATRSDKLKLLLLLRKSEFAVFWPEVERVVRMISAFPDTELIVKEHTRGGWKQPLSWNRGLRKLPNVRIVGDEVHSPHLLEWSDVVIDLATSVSFEAVKRGKPVLAADYLHASRSTVAAYMPETEIRCRDDIYHHLENFHARGFASFYVEENRQRFLDEILDVPDRDVLPRYLHLLEELAGVRRASATL